MVYWAMRRNPDRDFPVETRLTRILTKVAEELRAELRERQRRRVKETLPVDEGDVEVVAGLLPSLDTSEPSNSTTRTAWARHILKALQLNHRRRGVKWLRREVRGVIGLDATRLRIFCEEWDAAPWPGEEE